MAATSDVQISVNLAFPNAGVVIKINVEPPADGANGQAPSFRLNVTDISGRKAIPFPTDSSPPLADWVRGYSRWLRRSRITASHDENAITGSFDSDLSGEQVLQGVQDACDMVRQRFELYEESILA